jgi:hypothetical protein
MMSGFFGSLLWYSSVYLLTSSFSSSINYNKSALCGWINLKSAIVLYCCEKVCYCRFNRISYGRKQTIVFPCLVKRAWLAVFLPL